MTDTSLLPYLLTAAVLAAAGLYTALACRGAIAILIGIELMLNAAVVNFVAFARLGAATAAVEGASAAGVISAVMIVVIGAAEAAVALAIILKFYNTHGTIDVDSATQLRG